jgi:hypothetical protein
MFTITYQMLFSYDEIHLENFKYTIIPHFKNNIWWKQHDATYKKNDSNLTTICFN